MLRGGGRHSLSKIFQCYTTSNALTAVTTAKAIWYSDTGYKQYNSNMLSITSAFITLPDKQYSKITRKHEPQTTDKIKDPYQMNQHTWA